MLYLIGAAEVLSTRRRGLLEYHQKQIIVYWIDAIFEQERAS